MPIFFICWTHTSNHFAKSVRASNYFHKIFWLLSSHKKWSVRGILDHLLQELQKLYSMLQSTIFFTSSCILLWSQSSHSKYYLKAKIYDQCKNLSKLWVSRSNNFEKFEVSLTFSHLQLQLPSCKPSAGFYCSCWGFTRAGAVGIPCGPWNIWWIALCFNVRANITAVFTQGKFQKLVWSRPITVIFFKNDCNQCLFVSSFYASSDPPISRSWKLFSWRLLLSESKTWTLKRFCLCSLMV